MMQPFNDATRRNIAERCAAFVRLEPAATDLKRAVMPQLRSANVISTPPWTTPRRLWCLSSAISAYS